MSGTSAVEPIMVVEWAEPCFEELEFYDGPVNLSSGASDCFPEPLDEDYDAYDPYAQVSEELMAAGITGPDYAHAEPYLSEDSSKSSVDRLFGSASELYGKHWQRPLSRDLRPFGGPTQGHLQQVNAGTRRLTAKVEQDVLAALLRERVRAKLRLDRATASIINIIIGKRD